MLYREFGKTGWKVSAPQVSQVYVMTEAWGETSVARMTRVWVPSMPVRPPRRKGRPKRRSASR